MPAASALPLTVLITLSLLLTGCGEREPKPRQPDAESRRSLGQGDIIGFHDSGAHGWLGIPYAAPPTGALRWRAPRRPEAWTGVRQAVEFGAACPQIGTPLGGAPADVSGELWGDEDCLFLNVYAPARPADAEGRRLPVMVWIHGGGNTVGHSGFYDGAHLAAAHDTVVVTLNYRLGPLGWFLHPALADGADDPRDASGNYGTLDLIRALEWVQEHITAFDGDPDRVTIFGESAGGTNVVSLLVSKLAEGLFHGAIVQSGSTGSTAAAEAANYRDDPERPGAEFSSREVVLRVFENDSCDLSCARDQADALPSSELAARLRDLSGAELFALYRSGERLLGPASPAVLRDGHVLPAEPFLEVLEDPDAFHRVPVMLGTNRDEPKIFMAFNPDHVVRVMGLPIWRRDARLYDLHAEYGALAWQLRGVTEPAARLHAAGVPVWTYRWDWDEQGRRFGIDLSALLGAAHGLEIPFVFGHFDVGRQTSLIYHDRNAQGRLALSARMMAYWAGFARDLDPGRGADGAGALWAPATAADGPTFLHLDTDAGGGIRMTDERLDHAGFIERLANDDRFADAAERCAVFEASFRFDGDVRLGAAAEQLGCRGRTPET